MFEFHFLKRLLIVPERPSLPDRSFIIDLDNAIDEDVVEIDDFDFDTKFGRFLDSSANARVRSFVPPLLIADDGNCSNVLPINSVAVPGSHIRQSLGKSEHVCLQPAPL